MAGGSPTFSWLHSTILFVVSVNQACYSRLSLYIFTASMPVIAPTRVSIDAAQEIRLPTECVPRYHKQRYSRASNQKPLLQLCRHQIMSQLTLGPKVEVSKHQAPRPILCRRFRICDYRYSGCVHWSAAARFGAVRDVALPFPVSESFVKQSQSDSILPSGDLSNAHRIALPGCPTVQVGMWAKQMCRNPLVLSFTSHYASI